MGEMFKWISQEQLKHLRYVPKDLPAHRQTPNDQHTENDRNLRLKIKTLQKSLNDATQRIAMKNEQIKWLKRVQTHTHAKDKAAEWINAPMRRTFKAWLGVVRTAQRVALADAEKELDTTRAKQHQIQVLCDELVSEQVTSDMAFCRLCIIQERARAKSDLARAMRRWVPLRRKTPAIYYKRLKNSLIRLRLGALSLGRRQCGIIYAARDVRLRRTRLAFMNWAQEARAGFSVAMLDSTTFSRCRAMSIRRLWSRWMIFMFRRLRVECARSERFSARCDERVSKAENELLSAVSEANHLRTIKALWGDDDAPKMLSEFDKVIKGDSQSVVSGEMLRQCVSAHDSLKRHLSRERAATAVAREAARLSGEAASRAHQLLEQSGRREAELQEKLSRLEEEAVEKSLQVEKRDAAMFAMRRATSALWVSQMESLSALESSLRSRLDKVHEAASSQCTRVCGLEERLASVLGKAAV